MRTTKGLALAMALVLVTALGMAMTLSGSSKAGDDQPLTRQTFINVVKEARPAVVSIKINAEALKKLEQTMREQRAHPRIAPKAEGTIPPETMEGLPDWLKEFFKDLPPGTMIPMPRGPQSGEDMFRYPYGAGTGMIVRSDGYILTNRHVLFHPVSDEAMFKKGDITVILADGRKFTGDQVKFVAADQLTDMAVLKIDAKDLPTVQWADSDKVQLGEIVMAIGDPLELAGSVSEGIVSGMRREIEIAGYPQLLQTTAIINPGNSGGPLIDLDGKVVGVNMAIATSTRYWAGVGFAIPSDLARKTADDLIEKGHPVRGYIGIRMTDPEEFPALAAHEGYTGKNGVGVMDVYEDYPAAKGGLRPYDIITAIDGKDVDNTVAVQRMITQHRPGDKMEFKVFRGGKTETLTITAGEWPTEEKLMALSGIKPTQPAPGKGKGEEEEVTPSKGPIGMTVENWPDNPNAPESEKGVVIREIRAGSPAASAEPSLRVGDVILEVEKARVHNSDEFKKIVTDRLDEVKRSKAKEESTLLLRVRRGGRTQLVYLPLATQ